MIHDAACAEGERKFLRIFMHFNFFKARFQAYTGSALANDTEKSIGPSLNYRGEQIIGWAQKKC